MYGISPINELENVELEITIVDVYALRKADSFHTFRLRIFISPTSGMKRTVNTSISNCYGFDNK